MQTPNDPYTFMKITEGEVGGLTKLSENEMKNGIPSYWNTYVKVDSADDTVTKAKELGGKIIAEAFDVMDKGRMAVIASPSGAVLSIWQDKQDGPTPRTSGMNHGMYGWVELCTNNVDQDGQFYCNLFNWKPESKDMPNGQKYTSFMNGNPYPAAGMMPNQEEWGEMPSTWSIYFTVTNLDETIRKTMANGGKTIVEPFDVPNVGKMALLQDPTGAFFNIAQWDFTSMSGDC